MYSTEKAFFEKFLGTGNNYVRVSVCKTEYLTVCE